jgi:hypothetical protein
MCLTIFDRQATTNCDTQTTVQYDKRSQRSMIDDTVARSHYLLGHLKLAIHHAGGQDFEGVQEEHPSLL